MRILIIDDQIKLTASIKRGLEHVGYAVDIASDAATAIKFLLSSGDNYDIILLDIMLPDMSGLNLCKKIRSEGLMMPILMLTAKDSVSDKIEGLNVGADDYLVKPFEFDELTARIRALLRRPRNSFENKLSGSSITLDMSSRIVTRNGEIVKLTVKEFTILDLLLRNKNKVLSRDKIIAHVWDFNYDTFSNIVDVHIKNLRRKLGIVEANIIESVHGVGYRFNDI